MCTLTGVSEKVETKLEYKGRVAYKVLRVTEDRKQMTALFHHPLLKVYQFGRLETAVQSKFDRRHGAVAGLNSSSGFYVFKTYRQALEERKSTFGIYTPGISVARVRCFGRATVYLNGMRVQKMIVESIVCGRRPKK